MAPRKPNYRFERQERERSKQAKKAEKAAKKTVEQDPPAAEEPATPERDTAK